MKAMAGDDDAVWVGFDGVAIAKMSSKAAELLPAGVSVVATAAAAAAEESTKRAAGPGTRVAVVLEGSATATRESVVMVRVGDQGPLLGPDQWRAATVGETWPTKTTKGGGLDFSRVLTCFVKHKTGGGETCPQLTVEEGSGRRDDREERSKKRVGYFLASTTLAEAIGAMLEKPAFATWQQPQGTAFAVPSELSSKGADVTEIWRHPLHRLVNVHEGVLENHGVKGGKVVLQRGFYEYCHYMQDKCNDEGWGCAYRSLQTICSWLRLQGVTTRSVPTHAQIREALEEVGEHVEEKQWIGAVEISMVLHHWFGMDSRIVSVASGVDIGSKTEEICRHFEKEGTPIMIGGGVLAWTLLGICTNDKNETKYLILDPHYTGDEDLKTIQKKGWIAWQPASVFRKDSFYNLCCPLLPRK